MDFSKALDSGFNLLGSWADKKWGNDNANQETQPVIIQQAASPGLGTLGWVAIGGVALVVLMLVIKR